MRVSLRLKTTVLFVVVGTLPALATGSLLVNINTDAVRTSERTLQASVMSELAGLVQTTVRGARAESSRVADVLEKAAAERAEMSVATLKAVLDTTQYLGTVRLEVPSTGQNTLLRAGNVDFNATPTDLLKQAASDGTAEGFSDTGDWLLSVRLDRSLPNPTLLTATVATQSLAAGLERVVVSRFSGGRARSIVLDAQGRVLVSYGISPAEQAQAARLPAVRLLSTPVPEGQELAIVGSVQTERGPELVGAHVLADTGWRVFAWRPEADAYAAVTEMSRRTGHAALVTLLAALGLGWVAARRLIRPIEAMSNEALKIGARKWSNLATLQLADDELGDLGQALEHMAVRLQASEVEMERELRLRGELSRYMSKPLVDRIVEGSHSLRLGGARSDVTIVFADVVRFTQLAERENPEVVVAWLNELFAMLTEIVLRNGGVVDKFLGDSIMAFWGASEDNSHHARDALRAASEMTRFVAVANRDWRARSGAALELGVGVNSGECVVGNLGSAKRMEYTVIGDAVNTAARLEKFAAPGQVLVGASTKEMVASTGEFDFVFVGKQKVPGRSELLEVYELVSY